MVPAVTGEAPPACQAAAMKTAPGAAAKKTPTIAQKSLPLTRARVCTCVRRSFASPKRRTSSASRPNVFESRTPETESVSSTVAVMSARDSCTAFHLLSPAAPVRCVSHAKIGTTATVRSVNSGERISMATSELTTTTTFATVS